MPNQVEEPVERAWSLQIYVKGLIQRGQRVSRRKGTKINTHHQSIKSDTSSLSSHQCWLLDHESRHDRSYVSESNNNLVVLLRKSLDRQVLVIASFYT